MLWPLLLTQFAPGLTARCKWEDLCNHFCFSRCVLVGEFKLRCTLKCFLCTLRCLKNLLVLIEVICLNFFTVQWTHVFWSIFPCKGFPQTVCLIYVTCHLSLLRKRGLMRHSIPHGCLKPLCALGLHSSDKMSIYCHIYSVSLSWLYLLLEVLHSCEPQKLRNGL